MNGVDFVKVASYCIVQMVVERMNTTSPELNVHQQYKRICSEIKNAKRIDLQFATDCVIYNIVEENDVFPLSAEVTKRRIAANAAEFVEEFSKDEVCSKLQLEKLNYEETVKKFKSRYHCVYRELLEELSNADELAEPIIRYQKMNDLDMDYYLDYGFSDPNADYTF